MAGQILSCASTRHSSRKDKQSKARRSRCRARSKTCLHPLAGDSAFGLLEAIRAAPAARAAYSISEMIRSGSRGTKFSPVPSATKSMLPAEGRQGDPRIRSVKVGPHRIRHAAAPGKPTARRCTRDPRHADSLAEQDIVAPTRHHGPPRTKRPELPTTRSKLQTTDHRPFAQPVMEV